MVVQNEEVEHCTNYMDPAAVVALDSGETAGHTGVVVEVAAAAAGYLDMNSGAGLAEEAGLGGPESLTPPCPPNP